MKLQSWAKTLSLPLVGVVRLRFVFFTLARYRGQRTWATPAAFFPRLSEQQISLELDAGYTTAPAVVLELRDEIAAAWSLPLGQRVEVCFRGGERSARSAAGVVCHRFAFDAFEERGFFLFSF